MVEESAVVLPGGLWIDDTRFSDAMLRPISGAEEQLLSGSWAGASLPMKTTLILQQCLASLGPLRPVGLDAVRKLCLGDREALMLHLRRLTLGDRIQALFRCPNPECDEVLSHEMDIKSLLISPYPQWKKCYESSFSANDKVYRIKFRLPNGYDQERAERTALRDGLAAASDEMIKGCIIGAWEEDGSPLPSLSRDNIIALSSIMAELDSQAELLLKLNCPSCKEHFDSIFDAAGFLFQELANISGLFYYDVHMLAFYYHWPLKEIMSLYTMPRRRYVERLEDHLRGVS